MTHPVIREDIELVKELASHGRVTVRVPAEHEVYAGDTRGRVLIASVDKPERFVVYAEVEDEVDIVALFVEAAIAAALCVETHYGWAD
jgi:hypothetical protein